MKRSLTPAMVTLLALWHSSLAAQEHPRFHEASEPLIVDHSEWVPGVEGVTLPAPETLSPADPLAAQQAEAEKAAEALKQLGENVETLGKNLTVVTGKEDWRIILFGELRGEVLFATSRPIIPGAPLFLAPASPFRLSDDTVDVHGKSTLLGALVSGPEICGLKSGGLVLGALYSETVLADRYGFLPLQAFGELKDDSYRFAAGLQLDVFNPLIPNMVNFNNMYASGNAGAYRGEVRGEHYFYPDDCSQITLQAAIGEPLPTTITDTFRISEDNGWPNVEARAAWALGPVEGEGLDARRPFEVGVSGLVGEIRTTSLGNRVVADVWGVGADLRYLVIQRFGVQAEVFYGETLGTYLAGATQTVNSITFEGIRAAGGFAEVFCYLNPCVHVHVGYGIDDPRDEDLAAAQIARNETIYSTWFWDVTEDFRIGVEISYRETAYVTLRDNSGTLVHTQFQWTY